MIASCLNNREKQFFSFLYSNLNKFRNLRRTNNSQKKFIFGCLNTPLMRYTMKYLWHVKIHYNFSFFVTNNHNNH